MSFTDDKSALVGALEKCMTGGNHLVATLSRELGADFPEKHPPTADYWETLEKIGAGTTFDVWACWSQIMLARGMVVTYGNPA